MSNLRFPDSLPGLDITVTRDADYDVKVQQTQSRKELRWTYETYPLTRYKVGFEVLRSDASLSTRARELQQALTHIARHYGQLDSFLLIDPADSSVTDHGFAVGDGVTASFQLQRTLAGDVIDASGNSYHPQTKPYTNAVLNSSAETDANVDGVADNWNVYDSESATAPSRGTIVPGMNGGKAQRVSWGTPNTELPFRAKGVQLPLAAGTWVTNRWFTISFYARATGSIVGRTMSLNWNNAPSTIVGVANPALSTSWQRYAWQVFWNIGATPESSNIVFVTMVGTGVFGDLDFDLTQVVPGVQHGINDCQPIETPTNTAATRTPSYWSGYADGFEPIFDLNGDATIYEDGTWRGRRTLYPFTRTNLVPWSETFDNAAWVKTNSTITSNTTTAPDGTSNADTFNEGTAVTVQHFVEETIAAETTGELRCYSIFVKANTLPNITLLTNAGNTSLNFNLSTGAVVSQGTEIVASGVQTDPRWPGWFRVWWVHRATSLATSFRVVPQQDGSYSGAAYTGTSRTFFLWGAMCERVSNLNGPTPYIPTPSSVAVSVVDYTLGATGIFTPVAVPAAGTFYSWDGSFFRRVRFAQQAISVEQMVQALWAAKSLDLVTAK